LAHRGHERSLGQVFPGRESGRWHFPSFLERRDFAMAHRFTWWFHLLLSFGVLAWFPYTKMMHVFHRAAQYLHSATRPLGASLKAHRF
jgi:nitrate reductase gamma subunit